MILDMNGIFWRKWKTGDTNRLVEHQVSSLDDGGQTAHLRHLFRKSRLLFSSAMLRCSLYCSSCLHGDKQSYFNVDTGPGFPAGDVPLLPPCVLEF